MKRPDFQEKTEVKVISHNFTEYVRVNGVETNTDMYGWRGTVTAITGLDELGCMVPRQVVGRRQHQVARGRS